MTELELMAVAGASIVVFSLFVVVFGLGYAAGRVRSLPPAPDGLVYNEELDTWEYPLS